MKKVKFISSVEAAAMIEDGSMLATGGFVGAGVAEEIYTELEKRYLETGTPKNLKLMYTAGQGDGKTRGLNRFAHEGMLDLVVGGHWGLAPGLGKLANQNKIKAYNLPQGVMAHLFRDIAAGKPGTISHVGLGTFIDPVLQGGKINEITTEDVVEKIKLNNKEYLFYNGEKIAPKMDYALIRGTSSDESGNISMCKEALTLETLSLAMAVKNKGGKVIAQVEKKVKCGTIDPKLIQIPGILVDYVVVAKDTDTHHMQTFCESFNELYVNSAIDAYSSNSNFQLGDRKIIARRCAKLLDKDASILNYGIGMPEGVAEILKEEGQEAFFTPTVEPGAIGGTPVGGLSFGCSITPEAIIDQPYQFDFYDGGGLDVAFLGLAQCDQSGNINVSKFGPKIAGCGGFIDITQNAKEVVFCGTFTAGGLKIKVEDGKLSIENEGKFKKFLNDVEQITFSGDLAKANGKKITYVTERAVFELKPEGMVLTEIAPGVDIEKDILNQMKFKPIISEDLKLMDAEIFMDKPMNLSF